MSHRSPENIIRNVILAAITAGSIGIYSFFSDNNNRHSFNGGAQVTNPALTYCNNEPISKLIRQPPPTRTANMNQFPPNSEFTVISQPPGSEVMVRTSSNQICYTNRFALNKK